jgi:hypothetical protein
MLGAITSAPCARRLVEAEPAAGEAGAVEEEEGTPAPPPADGDGNAVHVDRTCLDLGHQLASLRVRRPPSSPRSWRTRPPDALGHVQAAGVDLEPRLRVERTPRLQDAAQLLLRRRAAGHRPAVALADDAVPVILGPRAHPHRRRVLAEHAERVVVADDAAARRQHAAVVLREPAPEGVGLEPAIVVLAVDAEDVGERQPGRLLDERVELEEGEPEPRREAAPDRRLARAAEAEERDPLRRRVGPPPLGVEQHAAGGEAEGLRERREPVDGDVRAPGLELGQEARREPAPRGQHAERQPALQPRAAHAEAEAAEERRHHVRTIVQRRKP